MNKEKDIYIVSYWGINDGRTITGGIRPYKLKKFLKERSINVKLIVPVKNEEDDIVVSEDIGKVCKFIFRAIYSPDYTSFWSKKVVSYFKSILDVEKEFTVITSMPPFGIGVVGLELKQYFPNCNWIADFRDLYTDSCDYKTQFYKDRNNKKYDQNFYVKSDLVLHTSKVYTSFVKEKYKVDNVITVRNGVDSIFIENIDKREGFIYSGSTYKGKGTKQILNIINQLKRNKLEIFVDFMGEDDEVIKRSENLNYLGRFQSDKSYNILKKYKFGMATLLNPDSVKEGRLLQKVLDYLSNGLIPIVLYPSLEIVNIFNELNIGIEVYDHTNFDVLSEKVKKASFRVDFEKLKTMTREYQFSKILDKI